MPIANYSTTIRAEKSITEIQSILAAHGARGVLVEYDGQRQPKQVRFSVIGPKEKQIYFTLPARAERIYVILNKQRIPKKLQTMEQARRVAWRLIKDWVRAQAALLEADLVEIEEIFLPYMTNERGETMFEMIKAKKFALPEHSGNREE